MAIREDRGQPPAQPPQAPAGAPPRVPSVSAVANATKNRVAAEGERRRAREVQSLTAQKELLQGIIDQNKSAPAAQKDSAMTEHAGATKAYPRSVPAMAASFLAPLTVDEIESHGFDRPGHLIGKAVGDGLMATVPLTKTVTLGSKFVKPIAKTVVGKNLAKAGEYAFASPRMKDRVLGQAGAGAIDNTLYTGIQNAWDEREHGGVTGSLAEMALSAGLGGLFGFAGGIPSYGQTVDFRNTMFKKTKAKEGSKKDREFDMYNRGVEGAPDNATTAADIIKNQEFNEAGLPPTWEQIGRRYDEKIAAGQKEAGRRAAAEKEALIERQNERNDYLNSEMTRLGLYPGDVIADVTERIPIRPAIFQSAADEKTFGKKVNDFLRQNKLGELQPLDKDGNVDFTQDLSVLLNPGVTTTDVERALREMRQGDFTTKQIKDYKQELRGAMRRERGGDDPREAGRDSRSLAEADDGSYNAKMNELEALHRERQIMNWASGGQGFGTPPEKFGLFSSFNKESRPQLGLYDLDLDMLQRNAAQAGVNLADNWEDIKAYYEIMRKFGEDSKEAMAKYADLPIEAKNIVANALNEMAPKAEEEQTKLGEALGRTRDAAEERLLEKALGGK